MAAYLLGKILFADCWGDWVKKVASCGFNCVFCSCPCLHCCFHDLYVEMQKILQGEGEYKGVLTASSFDPDPFTSLLDELNKRHSERNPHIREKYGLDLGMMDPEVKDMFSKVNEKYVESSWKDFCVGFNWSWPSAANAICCFCCDLTHYDEKLGTGEAHKTACCAWCSSCGNGKGQFLSTPMHVPKPESLKYGHRDQLVIIMSSPGDHHHWPGLAPPTQSNAAGSKGAAEGPEIVRNGGIYQGKPSDGNMHTWFETRSKDSEKHVAYCPIQARAWTPTKEAPAPAPEIGKPPAGLADGSWSEDMQKKWKDHVISKTGDPSSEYYEAWDGEDESGNRNGLDLWKAYWIAKIKVALADMYETFSVKKIIFVAVMGGGQGSEFERTQLERMNRLFHNRRLMERFIDMAIADAACCVTCGLACDGCKSAITWWQRAGAWAIFCSSVRKVTTELLFVHPSDLDAYLATHPRDFKLVHYPDRILPPDISDPKYCANKSYEAPPGEEMMRKTITPWMQLKRDGQLAYLESQAKTADEAMKKAAGEPSGSNAVVGRAAHA